MSHVRVVAVIAAGGQGTRMGQGQPKQYLSLGGRPLLWHSLSCFEASPLVHRVILVVRADDADYCRHQVLEPGGFRKVDRLVAGGEERWESVRAGVQATGIEDEVIVVHDAVRPFASQALISRVVAEAAVHGAAIAAVPVKETIKVADQGKVVQTPDRAGLWSAQTPQAFRRPLLLEGYAAMGGGPPPTDEATLVERLGWAVYLVPGEHQNLKITTPEDLAWAEWWLEQEGSANVQRRGLRVGQGYDVHRLEGGRRLILGGVEIPFTSGLVGHSDADVLVHALIDALLGAVAGGDIGQLFPDTDPQYLGISSLVLLERVHRLLQARRAEVLNVDAVVMAQRPRLAPHVPSMVANLAAALGLAPERVSVKATTTERLGFVGREEGISAQAVALVMM
jgi:2-C-methyl-D-erythritol 4-phosphate cytidylyltransferase/2-C-methyl-D-erythritol 2,4-cyclodiphosphate synthase